MANKKSLNELRRLAGLTESYGDDLDDTIHDDDDHETRYESNGKLVIEIGDGVMHDEDWHERFIDAAAKKGFVNGRDFIVHIARGDDVPHAVSIANRAILEDPELAQELDSMEGPSPY